MTTAARTVGVTPRSGGDPRPEPPLLTAEEFFARHENDRVELVRGRVVELPMPGMQHGVLCALIAYELIAFVRQRGLGVVVSNDSAVKTAANPDSVRGPDVAYFSYDRVPRGAVTKGIAPTPPDLAVEVRSPWDRMPDLPAKVAEYLAAGVRVVLTVDPSAGTVTVHRTDAAAVTLRAGEVLTVEDVLPGFVVPVERLLG